MKYLYTPATESAWTAIAGPQQLIVVDSPHADVVEKLWAQQADGVHSAMETLSSLGLSKTPSFALVEFASAVSGASSARVIVRGPVTVTVTTSTGEVSLSGATVSTWAEQQFDEVVNLRRTCGRFCQRLQPSPCGRAMCYTSESMLHLGRRTDGGCGNLGGLSFFGSRGGAQLLLWSPQRSRRHRKRSPKRPLVGRLPRW